MYHIRLVPGVPVPGGLETLGLAVKGVDANVDLVLVGRVGLLLGLVEHEVAILVELLLGLGVKAGHSLHEDYLLQGGVDGEGAGSHCEHIEGGHLDLLLGKLLVAVVCVYVVPSPCNLV